MCADVFVPARVRYCACPRVQSYLTKYSVGQVISGPSTCCNSMTWSGQFMAAANGVIDIFSVHDYPLHE